MKLEPRKALVVPANMHIDEVLRKMIDTHVSSALVHDTQGNVVGIFCLTRKLVLVLSLIAAVAKSTTRAQLKSHLIAGTIQ